MKKTPAIDNDMREMLSSKENSVQNPRRYAARTIVRQHKGWSFVQLEIPEVKGQSG